MTGLVALLFETDCLAGCLLETDKFKELKPLEKGSTKEFLRGPKKNGRGTAPNVRAWGARQLTIGIPFWFALMTSELVAYQIAFLCLLTRICGDIAQNVLDGCYWKVGLFLSFEGLALFLNYSVLF